MISQVVIYYGLFFMQLIAAIVTTNIVNDAGIVFIHILWWGLIFSFGLRCGWLQHKSKNKTYEAIGNVIAIVGMLVFLVLLITDGLITAFLIMLLWAQAAQNFTLTERRGLNYTFVISFVLLLYAAAISKSGLFLFYLAAYVLAAMFTLYINYLDQRNKIMTVEMASLGKAPVLGPVIGLSILTMTISLILYLSIPRLPVLHYGSVDTFGGAQYANKEWEKAADNSKYSSVSSDKTKKNKLSDDITSSLNEITGLNKSENKKSGNKKSKKGLEGHNDVYAGFEQRFDINASRQSGLSNAIILYLQADRPLYLKGKVFDEFDGRYWSNSRSQDKKHRLKQGQFEINNKKDAQEELVIQEITMAADYGDTIFVAERLHKLMFPAVVIAQDTYGTITAPAKLKKDTVYAAESYIGYVNGRTVSKSFITDSLDNYLQLPKNISNRIFLLASEVSKNTDESLLKVTAIEDYLRKEYSYTFDTVFDESNDIPLDTFLFETRKGHCEYFASAMVVMLRTLKIPARLVTGFSATNNNPLTGYYEVRGLDAHAWVEAYIPEYGWVAFEPTAFYDLPKPQASNNVSTLIEQYFTRLADIATTIEPDSFETSWLQMWSSIFKWIRTVWGNVVNSINDLGHNLIEWLKVGGLAIVVLLILLLSALYFFRHFLSANFTLWRLKLVKQGSNEYIVRKAYLALEKYFSGKGFSRNPSCTVSEYCEILRMNFYGKEESIFIITNYYIQIRYGKEMLQDSIADEVINHFQNIIYR